jgi:Zn-dependent peptidase ImmA (M78 family)
MVQFLDAATIDQEVDRFLAKYHPSREIPIPVEEIAELQFGLQITPIRDLMNDLGIDGFLSNDLTELYIDHDIYMNRPTRSRFTFAHELGHIWLHKVMVTTAPATVEQWKQVKLQMSPDHRKMETQANMFAGQLLMPSSELAREFKAEKALVQKQLPSGAPMPPDKTLAPYLAKNIAKTFDVSEIAATNRIHNRIDKRT